MNEPQKCEFEFFGRVAVAESLSDLEIAVHEYCVPVFNIQSIIALRFYKTARPDVLFRWITDVHLRTFFETNYPSLGYMLDPFFKHSFSVSGLEAHRLRDIAPDRFESCEYVATYFSVTRMVDEMGWVMPLDEHSSLHLSFGRDVGQRRLRTGELERFRQISKVIAPKLAILVDQYGTSEASKDSSLKDRFLCIATTLASSISKREAEVAEMIVQGHSSRSIGLTLGISPQTVKVHRRSLYKKLNISSQNELYGLLTRQAAVAKQEA